MTYPPAGWQQSQTPPQSPIGFESGIFASGQYTTTPAATRTVGVPTFQRLFLTPLWVPKTTPITSIACETTIGAAGSLERLGIFAAADATLKLFNLLLDAGTVDASVVGRLDAALNMNLPAGMLWLASCQQGVGGATTRNLANTGAGYLLPNTTPEGAANVPSVLFLNNVVGAFPAQVNIVSDATAGGGCPVVWVKAA